jgi:hypothetical protein
MPNCCAKLPSGLQGQVVTRAVNMQDVFVRCVACRVLWRCRVRAMRAGIEARDSCWWVQRLFNMSTITREWVALQHAHLMPFRCGALGSCCKASPSPLCQSESVVTMN